MRNHRKDEFHNFLQFVIILESFAEESTDTELINLFSQQMIGQNEQTILGEFTLDSTFTNFSGMLILISLNFTYKTAIKIN